MDRPGFSNPCRCQLCQTLGGINLTVDIEDSTKKTDQMLTSAEMTVFELNRKSIISAAAKTTARCNDPTQKRSLRPHPPTLYVQGDLVLIRCTNVRHKLARKNYVTKGKSIACNYNLHRYKVRFVHPNVRFARRDDHNHVPLCVFTWSVQHRSCNICFEQEPTCSAYCRELSVRIYRSYRCRYIEETRRGCMVIAGIACEWSISRLVRLAGKSSGFALRLRSFFLELLRLVLC